VNNQYGFADLRLESILARERADLAFENDMGGNELAHKFERLRKVIACLGNALKFSIVATRNIEVVFANVIDTIVMQEFAALVCQALARRTMTARSCPI